MTSSTYTPGQATVTDTRTTTESWADGTHSVIWMKHGGSASVLTLGRQPIGSQAFSLTVVAVLSLLATLNLVDVYGSVPMWAVAAVPATLLGAAVAWAGVFPALRLWWQIVFLAAAQWLVGPVVTLNGTAIGHVIPTPETLSRGWEATFGSFKYLIAIEPPIGTSDGSLMAVWTIALWMTFLAGAFAVMPNGKLSAVAVIPILAGFTACALLGTSSGFLRVPAGVAAAVIAMVWVSWRWGSLELGRWLGSLAIILLAVALAVGGCLLVGQRRTVLRDHYDPPVDLSDVTSPLSGMRAYIKDHKDDTLLTVTDLPAGTPVRLAVMDRFDGNVWNLSAASDAQDSSSYRRVGRRIDNDADDGAERGRTFTATFRVHQGFEDQWLPLAGAATSVDFGDDDGNRDFYYNAVTDAGLLDGGVADGLTYTETGVIPVTPTDEQIDQAEAAADDQPQARDVPDSVGDLAAAVAGGQAGGAAARALADTLKDTGWFSHGLSGDYPSPPGHGNYRIDRLLTGSAMVGDSEQYASAMALMARELGLPSRVVLGFLPKDDNGGISEERTEQRADGSTVVEFTGNDIEAWVEIDLKGYGWVAFYPTPNETKTPDDNQNLTPPSPQTLVRQPPVPLTDPLRDDAQAHGQSSLTGEDAEWQEGTPLWRRIAAVARTVAVYGSPVWAVLLVCALILLVKALHLLWMRRHGTPRQRVAQGWRALTMLARQSGVDSPGNRRDQARDIAGRLNLAADQGAALAELGREADYAAFSGKPLRDEQARDYWTAVGRVRRAMLASLPLPRRWRAKLSLRGLSGRIILATMRRRADKRKGR